MTAATPTENAAQIESLKRDIFFAAQAIDDRYQAGGELQRSDPEYRRLWAEHQRLRSELEKRGLTSDDFVVSLSPGPEE